VFFSWNDTVNKFFVINWNPWFSSLLVHLWYNLYIKWFILNIYEGSCGFIVVLLQLENADLSDKIHQERQICIAVKVQNRMMQQRNLELSGYAVDDQFFWCMCTYIPGTRKTHRRSEKLSKLRHQLLRYISNHEAPWLMCSILCTDCWCWYCGLLKQMRCNYSCRQW